MFLRNLLQKGLVFRCLFSCTSPNALTHYRYFLFFIHSWFSSPATVLAKTSLFLALVEISQAVLTLGTPEFLIPGQPLTFNITSGAYVWFKKIFAHSRPQQVWNGLSSCVMHQSCPLFGLYSVTRSLLIFLFSCHKPLKAQDLYWDSFAEARIAGWESFRFFCTLNWQLTRGM